MSMSMKCANGKLATALCCAAVAFAPGGAAAADNQPAQGTLGRLLFGDDFGAASNTTLGGWIETGVVLKDDKGQPSGLGNSPVVLARDNGAQLNQTYVYLEKGIRSNIIPRATPIPAPVFEDYQFGYYVDLLYGRDGQPLQTAGWDAKWSVNDPGNSNPAYAKNNRQNFLVNPQAYLQAYMPWGLGTTVIAGNFMSPIGNEIGFHPQPGPNIFYSHTYSFAAAPIKHTGVLVDTNLMKSDANGLLAAEFGVVRGWSNLRSISSSDKWAYIGALRWRSPGMDTWVDYEFMTGDSQTDGHSSDFRDSNIPVTTVISPRGQKKTQQFVTISHDWDENWHAQAGFHRGTQKGDGQADTIFIGTGPGFKGASWSGFEARLKYKFDDKLSVAGRIERFKNPDGFALIPNTGVASDFNAITVGVQYWYNKHVLVRPELRRDWQSNNAGVKAFNGGLSDKQTSLNADVIFYF